MRPRLDVLEIHDEGELLGGDAGRIVDGAVGIREGDGLGAELVELLDGVLGDVAGARHRADLALQPVVAGLEHFLREIDRAVAGGFRTDERAAPLQALAGEHAGELVAHALVLAEHVADLAAAHADVAGRHVGVGADVAASSVMKLWQKRITSASLLPFGSKSEPPLPPPMGRVVSEFLKICSKPRNFRMPTPAKWAHRRSRDRPAHPERGRSPSRGVRAMVRVCRGAGLGNR